MPLISRELYAKSIFLNYPYDESYNRLEKALVFAVAMCGYIPRSAREEADSGKVRLEKILKIVEGCRLGIHDITRTETDSVTGLPRFNMPFELGLFIGASKLGSRRHKEKVCVILDTDPYRYRSFLSDISGQDVEAHSNDPEKLIGIVRNWLNAQTRDVSLPGKTYIAEAYNIFLDDFPIQCEKLKLKPQDITFIDFSRIVTRWITDHIS